MNALILLLALSQQVYVDTTSQGYPSDPALADSLAGTAREVAFALGLTEWRIFLHFSDSLNPGVIASTSADISYLIANVTFSLPKFKPLVAWSREEAIRHEMLHIVLWEYISYIRFFTSEGSWKILRQITEKVTTKLTRMPLWQK